MARVGSVSSHKSDLEGVGVAITGWAGSEG